MAAVVDKASPLAERIAEVIEEFSECNDITDIDALEALEYLYACIERHTEMTPPHKMH